MNASDVYGILPDWVIKELIYINPFSDNEKRLGIISYGLSSYGYDLRIGRKFKLFSAVHNPGIVVDPKNMTNDSFHTMEGDYCIIPPNHYALGETIEYIKLPRDVIAIAIGKSTYARSGIIVNVTPIEPEWEGYITIEISNSTPLPAKIYANEGICQLLFLRSTAICTCSYADKKGIYQDQKGLTLAKIRSKDDK